MDILIGADPEIFVKDAEGKLVSAYGLIPGTKNEPCKVDGGAVQVDGMALEFNIDPAKNINEFVANIARVQDQLKAMLPEGYDFAIQPTAEFGKDYIDAQPAEASDLGCNPDFNAYTGEPNPKPDVNAPFRTASGHIHIGWTKDMDPFDPGHFEACQMLTKQLDCILGVPSLLWDTDAKRRELYGKPGAFRPKPYGCEYRVLSNAWLTSPHLTNFVYRNTVYAVEQMLKGAHYYGSNYGYNPRQVFNPPKTDWFVVSEYYEGLTDRYAGAPTSEKVFMRELWEARVNEAAPKKKLRAKKAEPIDFGLEQINDLDDIQALLDELHAGV